MALWGNLSTLPLSDILVWVAGNEITGMLSTQFEGREVDLVFRDGQLDSIRAGNEKDRFGQHLIDQGVVDREKVDFLINESRPQPLGRSLVDDEVLTEAEVREYLRNHAIEMSRDLCQWRGGTFIFQRKEVPENGGIPYPLSVHELLLEVHRRIDETLRANPVPA